MQKIPNVILIYYQTLKCMFKKNIVFPISNTRKRFWKQYPAEKQHADP